jgi:hypothetical protein
MELAAKDGPYSTYEGSPISQVSASLAPLYPSGAAAHFDV